jgi:hypothetical protein
VHPLHVRLSVHLDRSAFAFSTFSSTFHLFRILRCYNHSYLFAFGLCMVLARAWAAHVFHCTFLANLSSSSYLAALTTLSKFHVSLAFFFFCSIAQCIPASVLPTCCLPDTLHFILRFLIPSFICLYHRCLVSTFLHRHVRSLYVLFWKARAPFSCGTFSTL